MASFNLQKFQKRHYKNNLKQKVSLPLKYQIPQLLMAYTPDELHGLCRVSIEAFSKEPMLVESEAPSAVVGDTVGHSACVKLIFDNMKEESPRNFIFLGNYIGKSEFSLETLCLLLAYKLKRGAPSFYLLRGRNECVEESRRLGFEDELIKRFGEEEGKKLFNHFNEVFSWMPVAGIVGGNKFCVCGGLSPHLKSLDDIEKIPRPLVDFSTSPLGYDLLHAVPNEDCRTFIPNPDRPFSVVFGKNHVMKFLLDFNMEHIVRVCDADDKDVEPLYEETSCDKKLVSLRGALNVPWMYFGSCYYVDSDGKCYCNGNIDEDDCPAPHPGFEGVLVPGSCFVS